MVDARIVHYREAAEAMAEGHFHQNLSIGSPDEVGRLGEALTHLGRTLEHRCEEVRTLAKVTERINAGLLLDEVMDKVYRSFRTIIPYDRLGLALLEKNEQVLTARWTRSEAREVHLTNGYSGSLTGSSLQAVIESRQPRILNDLGAYLRAHPGSESTGLIVEEGMQSSLTCPLIAKNKTIGMLFFTSLSVDTYRKVHQEVFVQIAGQLSLIVEKGRLYQELQELNAGRNRLLETIAHDLYTPLALDAQRLQSLLVDSLGSLDPEQARILQLIAEDHQILLNKVQGLLELSALEPGTLDLKASPAEWREFLLGIQKFVKGHGGSLRMERHPSSGSTVTISLPQA